MWAFVEGLHFRATGLDGAGRTKGLVFQSFRRALVAEFDVARGDGGFLRLLHHHFMFDAAEDAIGGLEDGANGGHVVHAYDVGAFEDGGDDGGGGGAIGIFHFLLAEERLAGGADEDGQIETDHFAEAGDQFIVLFATFAEAEARIEDDAVAFDAGAAGAVNAGFEIVHDRLHGVGHGAELGPGFGRAAHVVEDQAGVGFGDNLSQFHVEGQRAGIVDDFSAVFERLDGDAGFAGVDRDGHTELALEAFQNRDEPAEFFGFRDTLGTGAC